MPRAVVLGVNGQDGGYAAETLLARGYQVTGVGRQAWSRYVAAQSGFTYAALDLADGEALGRLLTEQTPDAVYHFAAVHGPNAPAYEPAWRQMVEVNVLSLHAVLEHARLANPALGVVYASSAKIFGPLAGRIDEATPRVTSCLYSNTKNSAFDLIGHYRRKHGVPASNLILFNHESPRRPRGFFVPDLVACLAAALEGSEARQNFRTLDFYVDWSDAAELMELAVAVAERGEGMDVVFASGRTWHGRAMVEELFRRHGLDYRRHVGETAPAEGQAVRFDASIDRLEEAAGRRPLRDIFAIAEGMLHENHKFHSSGVA